ncbi:hypothetical protein ORJ04_19215, partial [Rheinheimera baltica]
AKHYLLRKNTAARQPFAKCQKRLNHCSGNVILSVLSVTPTAAYVAAANCRSTLAKLFTPQAHGEAQDCH